MRDIDHLIFQRALKLVTRKCYCDDWAVFGYDTVHIEVVLGASCLQDVGPRGNRT
ncbi:hypothetical protein [Rhizobium sp. Rhizsp42]|uniref:hypothetical protein n=1 Tax=Rhizobium sp. Rhizsp42 TaxID=3243034 RepID=UPI0039AEB766